MSVRRMGLGKSLGFFPLEGFFDRLLVSFGLAGRATGVARLLLGATGLRGALRIALPAIASSLLYHVFSPLLLFSPFQPLTSLRFRVTPGTLPGRGRRLARLH